VRQARKDIIILSNEHLELTGETWESLISSLA
jgi:hypothetical protein